MKPAPFEYHRPATVEDAVSTLAEVGDAGKLLAGGQSLIPMLALRLASFDHLVDVGRIDDLKGIEPTDGSVRIGAMTLQSTIERSPDLAAAVPLLARAVPHIGHFQIRNRGTVGGSIAHADPAAELPAVALALDAEMEVQAPSGRRTIPAGDFFTGLWSTALEEDELLVALSFPVWSGRCGFAVREFARRHGDFAIAGAAVAVELDADDRVARCGLGLFGLGSTPERPTAAESAAVGTGVDTLDPVELGHQAMAGLTAVPADLHGSEDYRRQVGAAMTTAAWQAAVEEARRA